MTFKIRSAAALDAKLLANFRYAFRIRLGAANESEAEFIERCSLWMRERLSENDDWRCWIAEEDSVLVGHLWAQLITKIPNPTAEPELHLYLTNFYVRAEMRNRGIGSMLLSAALDWCTAWEVDSIFLWSTDQSRSLYVRHGFAARENLLELIPEARRASACRELA